MGTAAGLFNHSNKDIQLNLVFFSPSEELCLRTAGIMESKGITGYTRPPLFQLSVLEGLRTSSGKFLSFHAFWKEMEPQLFHIITAEDRRTLLSAAEPMVQALASGGAAMFTKSTPGCGILDSPSH
jgi:hypothetical protein